MDAHDQRAQQPESRTTADRRGNNSLTSDRNAPIIAVEKKTITAEHAALEEDPKPVDLIA